MKTPLKNIMSARGYGAAVELAELQEPPVKAQTVRAWCQRDAYVDRRGFIMTQTGRISGVVPKSWRAHSAES